MGRVAGLLCSRLHIRCFAAVGCVLSGAEWLLLVAIIVGASGLAGAYLGMIADKMGSDDREPPESKPADLWAGYERRKCKAGETHDRS